MDGDCLPRIEQLCQYLELSRIVQVASSKQKCEVSLPTLVLNISINADPTATGWLNSLQQPTKNDSRMC